MILQLNDEGVLEKANEEKLVQVNEDELDELINRHNKLKEENEQLKLLLDFADDLIISNLRKDQIGHWENIKKNIKR